MLEGKVGSFIAMGVRILKRLRGNVRLCITKWI